MTGGDSPFHAEVYFINRVEQMGISWGTNSKVQYMDPEFGFPLSLGASGEMTLAVEDSRRLLVKIVGTDAVLSQDRLVRYFKAFLQTRIKNQRFAWLKKSLPQGFPGRRSWPSLNAARGGYGLLCLPD